MVAAVTTLPAFTDSLNSTCCAKAVTIAKKTISDYRQSGPERSTDFVPQANAAASAILAVAAARCEPPESADHLLQGVREIATANGIKPEAEAAKPISPRADAAVAAGHLAASIAIENRKLEARLVLTEAPMGRPYPRSVIKFREIEEYRFVGLALRERVINAIHHRLAGNVRRRTIDQATADRAKILAESIVRAASLTASDGYGKRLFTAANLICTLNGVPSPNELDEIKDPIFAVIMLVAAMAKHAAKHGGGVVVPVEWRRVEV